MNVGFIKLLQINREVFVVFNDQSSFHSCELDRLVYRW